METMHPTTGFQKLTQTGYCKDGAIGFDCREGKVALEIKEQLRNAINNETFWSSTASNLEWKSVAHCSLDQRLLTKLPKKYRSLPDLFTNINKDWLAKIAKSSH